MTSHPVAAPESPQRLQDSLSHLLLYQNVLQQPVIAALVQLLAALEQADQPRADQPRACQRAYGQWFRSLLGQEKSWSAIVLEAVLLDENPFSQRVQQQSRRQSQQQSQQPQQPQQPSLEAQPKALLQAAGQDLQILYSLAHLPAQTLADWVQQGAGAEDTTGWTPVPGPPLSSSNHLALDPQRDWSEQIEALAQHYQRWGTGLLGRFRALRWQGSQLEGIATPDPITLDQLVGYEEPKQRLLQNTERLLGGLPALHVLLYGSRGTGKSSLVKALIHQYGEQGLRLIELPKAHLIDLPQLVEHLRDRPQCFVVFVDDLSFEADDESFKALKVVLEGSVTARAHNVVVYATSNRRHLIREFHQDRPTLRSGDRRSLHHQLSEDQQGEIHAWDTVQEKLSFSDRFGLTLTFIPPQQDTYLAIVRHLAQYYGLTLPTEELDFQARHWATRNNGQSGRSARQFIDWLRGEAQGGG